MKDFNLKKIAKSAKDLLLTNNEPFLYLENFIPIVDNGITLITGKSDIGKTHLLLEIGIKFLIENNYNKKIVFFNRNDNIEFLAYKLNQLIKNSSQEEKYQIKENFFFFPGCKNDIDFTDKTNLKELKEFGLIVIDDFSFFIYKADEMKKTLSKLKEFSLKERIPIIISCQETDLTSYDFSHTFPELIYNIKSLSFDKENKTHIEIKTKKKQII